MNIVFEFVRYKNFLSTGATFTQVDLNKTQSTLIVGENGAGKSTFLDALSFCLYGRPFRRVNKPQLVNSINKKQLIVECQFKIGKITYLIRRGLKPSMFEIYRDGDLINQDAKARDYQLYLEKEIIKLSHKSFTQIVVLGSSTFIPFMQLSAQHRREIIEDLLDLQIFSLMNSMLKEEVQFNEENIKEVLYNSKLINEKINMQRAHIEEIENRKAESIDRLQNLITTHIDTIKHLNKKLDTINVRRNNLSKEIVGKNIDEHITLLKKCKSYLVDSTSKQADYQRHLDFFDTSETCNTCEQDIDDIHKKVVVSKYERLYQDAKDKIELLTNKIEEQEEYYKQYSSLVEQDNKLAEQLAEVNNKIKLTQALVDTIEEQIVNIQKQHIINDDTNQLDDLSKQLKECDEQEKHLVNLKHSLSICSFILKDTGIKTKMIKQYVPIMNKLINKYLAAMDFFVQFELDENFDEKILSRHRDVFSYQSFSEGEKARIDLALLFTWRSISKLRNSVSMNLLVMDEVFDGSLDLNGSEELMKIVRELAPDQNVFIISHKTEAYIDQFAHIVKFEKNRGFSKMVA